MPRISQIHNAFIHKPSCVWSELLLQLFTPGCDIVVHFQNVPVWLPLAVLLMTVLLRADLQLHVSSARTPHGLPWALQTATAAVAATAAAAAAAAAMADAGSSSSAS